MWSRQKVWFVCNGVDTSQLSLCWLLLTAGQLARLSLPALHSRLLSWCPLPSDDVTLAAAPPAGSKPP